MDCEVRRLAEVLVRKLPAEARDQLPQLQGGEVDEYWRGNARERLEVDVDRLLRMQGAMGALHAVACANTKTRGAQDDYDYGQRVPRGKKLVEQIWKPHPPGRREFVSLLCTLGLAEQLEQEDTAGASHNTELKEFVAWATEEGWIDADSEPQGEEAVEDNEGRLRTTSSEVAQTRLRDVVSDTLGAVMESRGAANCQRSDIIEQVQREVVLPEDDDDGPSEDFIKDRSALAFSPLVARRRSPRFLEAALAWKQAREASGKNDSGALFGGLDWLVDALDEMSTAADAAALVEEPAYKRARHGSEREATGDAVTLSSAFRRALRVARCFYAFRSSFEGGWWTGWMTSVVTKEALAAMQLRGNMGVQHLLKYSDALDALQEVAAVHRQDIALAWAAHGAFANGGETWHGAWVAGMERLAQEEKLAALFPLHIYASEDNEYVSIAFEHPLYTAADAERALQEYSLVSSDLCDWDTMQKLLRVPSLHDAYYAALQVQELEDGTSEYVLRLLDFVRWLPCTRLWECKERMVLEVLSSRSARGGGPCLQG